MFLLLAATAVSHGIWAATTTKDFIITFLPTAAFQKQWKCPLGPWKFCNEIQYESSLFQITPKIDKGLHLSSYFPRHCLCPDSSSYALVLRKSTHGIFPCKYEERNLGITGSQLGDPFQNYGSPENATKLHSDQWFLALLLEKSFKLFLPQLPSLITEERWYHLFQSKRSFTTEKLHHFCSLQ